MRQAETTSTQQSATDKAPLLACASHDGLKATLQEFVAGVVGLYEYTSARGRFLSGTCARCHGDLTIRIGTVAPHAPVYRITRDLIVAGVVRVVVVAAMIFAASTARADRGDSPGSSMYTVAGAAR